MGVRYDSRISDGRWAGKPTSSGRPARDDRGGSLFRASLPGRPASESELLRIRTWTDTLGGRLERPHCDWKRRVSNLLVPALRSSASLELGARANAQTGVVVGTLTWNLTSLSM